MNRNDAEERAILESDISTARLLALALTLPVRDFRNELFGRSHAWYSIASSQEEAIEFVLVNPDSQFQREIAARALARSGNELRHLRTPG